MSASMGMLPPVLHDRHHVRGAHLSQEEKDDPVQAVMNRAWARIGSKDGVADRPSAAHGLTVQTRPMAGCAASRNAVAASPSPSHCKFHRVHDLPALAAGPSAPRPHGRSEQISSPDGSERKVVRRSGVMVARSQSGPSIVGIASLVQSASIVDPWGQKPDADCHSGCDLSSLVCPNALNFGEPSPKSRTNGRGPHVTSASSHSNDKAINVPRRRYSLDLSASLDDADSPQFLQVPEYAREGSFRRLMFDPEVRNSASCRSPNSAKPSVEDGKDQDKSALLIGLAHGLPAAVGQASMRMNGLLSLIRKRFHDDPSFLENVPNYERLVDIEFMVATANYHLAKWIHQLDRRSPTPGKPAKTSPRSEPAPERVLAQVQLTLSRMDVLSSTLTQLLQQVIADAKAMRRRAAEPITPTFRNPARVAMKRGLLDIDELRRLPSHLEHLLWATGNLANSPAQRSFKQAGTAVQAAVKFRLGLGRKLPERRHTAEGILNTPKGDCPANTAQGDGVTIS